MEHSTLSSSKSEPTTSGIRTIFKKPSNVIQAFEVSMNESTIVDVNKSKTDLDVTSLSDKIEPFKKPKTISSQMFSVNSNESITDSECEKSVVCSKSLFKPKTKPNNDLFNVSFNETNVNVTQNQTIGKSSANLKDDSTTIFNKSNPFKRKSKGVQEQSLEKRSLMQVSLTAGDGSIDNTAEQNMENAHENVSFDCSSFSTDIDPTNFMSKSNPFKKNIGDGKERYSMDISLTANKRKDSTEDLTSEKEVTEKSSSGKIVDKDKFSFTHSNKSNEFQISEEISSESNEMQNISQVSSVEEDFDNKSTENQRHDPLVAEKSAENSKLTKSMSKLTNKSNTSEMFLDQSSFNDENLNNWMSDHSDEEICPPSIPPIAANTSVTKEKPQEKPLSPVKTNWEQKFNEIVSKSQKGNKSGIGNKNWEKKFTGIASNSKKGLQTQNDMDTCRKSFKKTECRVSEESKKYKSQKLAKPAYFATKRLYQHIIKKLEPKYGVDTMIEAEQLVFSICDTVKKVTRRKSHQKKLIHDLKMEMAKAGLVETTVDFHEFVINFLPYTFRVKVVPCVQPVSNTVYPPKEGNPFDKILN